MLLQLAPYFGYLASLMLIIALIVTTDLKFRWFNVMGNISFIIYAIVLNAFPVLLTNVILLTINLYYLIKIYNHTEDFDLLEFTGEEILVEKFIHFYKNDIESYFPGFHAGDLKGRHNFVVLRDLVIANIFSADISPAGDARVVVNYTPKRYRDYKVGRFIFDKEKEYLRAKGIRRIVYDKVMNRHHGHFLKVMGFKQSGDGMIKILKHL
jgi:hypothetical protein